MMGVVGKLRLLQASLAKILFTVYIGEFRACLLAEHLTQSLIETLKNRVRLLNMDYCSVLIEALPETERFYFFH